MTHWKRFNVTRGDTIVLDSLLKDDEGDPLDVTGATIVSTLKEAITDTVNFAQISTAGGGIVINDGAAGDITRTFAPSVTADVALGTKLWGDVQVTLADGTRGTPEHFVLIVQADVTA